MISMEFLIRKFKFWRFEMSVIMDYWIMCFSLICLLVLLFVNVKISALIFMSFLFEFRSILPKVSFEFGREEGLIHINLDNNPKWWGWYFKILEFTHEKCDFFVYGLIKDDILWFCRFFEADLVSLAWLRFVGYWYVVKYVGKLDILSYLLSPFFL